MADPKDCPTCGLVNPPDAQRCDCGYDFVARRVLGSYLPGAPAGCQVCGADAETRHVSFHQNIGLLVLRLHSSVQGQLCKACIQRHFWGKTATTALLGWWGIVSFFMTPFILVGNLMQYLSCRGMAPPPTRASAGAAGGSGPPAQLVGQACVHCGERISCDPDGQFCRGCGSPVHDACARPGGGSGCPACGAAVRAS
jgi:hypothetical protein